VLNLPKVVASQSPTWIKNATSRSRDASLHHGTHD